MTVEHSKARRRAAARIGFGVAALGAARAWRRRMGEGGNDRPEGATRSAMRHPQRARRSITVNRSLGDVYRFWRDLERLPSFMTHLDSVEVTGERTSRWRAEGPGGTTIEWEAELVEDVPEQLLAWRSVAGSDVASSGTVRFRRAPGAQGTEVTVELDYEPPGGAIGAAAARLLGQEPAQQVADELRRAKQVLETGSVMVSSARPEGARVSGQLRPSVAQPVA